MSFKVVVAGDLHFDARTDGVSRFADVRAAFEQSVEYACDHRVDLFVQVGDVCDPDDGPDVIRALAVMVSAASVLSEHDITMLVVAGNHDVVNDPAGTTVLSPLRGLSNVIVAEQGLIREVCLGRWVLALPYPSAARPYDPAKVLREHLPRVGQGNADATLMVFAHLVVPGLLPGEEATKMARGKGVDLPLDVLREVRPRLIVCGHHHRRQVTPDGVYVAGSMARLTHGEETSEPAFLIFEVQ